MNQIINNKYFKSTVLCAVLIGITSYYLFRGGKIHQILTVIKDIHPYYLLAGFLLMLLFILFETLSIKILLNSLHYRLSFWKCIKYAFIGFYFSSITPTSSGQPVQIYYMKKDGIEIGESTLSILIITISYQAAMLLLSIIMFSVRTELIYNNFGALKYFLIFGVTLNLSIIILFIFIALKNSFLKMTVNGCIKLLSFLKIIKNPGEAAIKADLQIQHYKKGAEYLKTNPRILLWVLIQRIMQILSRLAVTFAVYKAFGLSGYGLLDILALQTILALAVESVPIPGSIGVTEIYFLKVNRILFGADKLLPAMLLNRGISFYVMLIISGGVVLTAHFLSAKHPVSKDVTPE